MTSATYVNYFWVCIYFWERKVTSLSSVRCPQLVIRNIMKKISLLSGFLWGIKIVQGYIANVVIYLEKSLKIFFSKVLNKYFGKTSWTVLPLLDWPPLLLSLCSILVDFQLCLGVLWVINMIPCLTCLCKYAMVKILPQLFPDLKPSTTLACSKSSTNLGWSICS